MGMIMFPVSTLRSIALVFLLMLGLLTPLSAQSPDDMRRDFEAVQKLNTREAYEAFLKQYPEGLYAGLAREELKKLDAKVVVDLVRALNFELARVGCAPNAGGDEWTPESEAAIARFNTHAKANLKTDEISGTTLDTLRGKTGRVCPLVCGPNERAQGDSCVAVLPQQQQKQQEVPQKTQKKAEPKGATWCVAMVGAVGQQRCGFASEAQCLAAKVDPRARCFRSGG